MPTSVRCKGLDPSPDGARCLNCDRPIATYPSDVPGQTRVEHKRGNWRLKGQVGVLPRVADTEPRKRGWTVPFVHGGPAPVRTGSDRVRKACPDCDAPMQLIPGTGWRCPWTSSARSRRVDGALACDWPYRGGRQEYAPFGARATVNAA